MTSRLPYLLIATAGSIAFIVIAIAATVPTYRVSPVFLVPILWAAYLLRRKIDLHWLHYLLFAIALLLHDLGAFGFYQRNDLGLSFDIYVHFYFGFVAALIVQRALHRWFQLKGLPLAALTLLVIMGCGAIHELVVVS